MSTMRSKPTLAHPILCRIILYVPALCALVMIPFMVVSIVANMWSGIFAIAVFLLCVTSCVFYLRDSLWMFMVTDVVFAYVSCWSRDREHYYTDINGKDRASAEQAIAQRMSRNGETCEVRKTEDIAPLSMVYRRKKSHSAFWAALEDITLLYSVDVLNIKKYTEIVDSARSNARPVMVRKSDLKLKKKQQDAAVSTAVAVVILADQVTEEVIQSVRKHRRSKDMTILTCVADFGRNCYHMDGMKRGYEPILMKRPTKNRAHDLVVKAVFDGKLPLKDNNEMSPYTNTLATPETSLWTLIWNCNKERIGITKDERKMMDDLPENGVAYHTERVYVKYGSRVARLSTKPNDSDHEARLVASAFEWYSPKRNRISLDDKAAVETLAGDFLTAQGIKFEFVEESSETMEDNGFGD